MGCISNLRLKLAAKQMYEGKLVAYPTEAVWGLGCDPLNPRAISDLLDLKGRTATKGFILIAADFGQIEPFVDIASEQLKGKLLACWPGPVTWIVPMNPQTPVWLRGNHDTIAVRVTAHPVASALCKAFGGAIVSTSANLSGLPPARTQLKIRCYFPGGKLNFLPGAIGGLDRPTAIFDALSGTKLR